MDTENQRGDSVYICLYNKQQLPDSFVCSGILKGPFLCFVNFWNSFNGDCNVYMALKTKQYRSMT